MGRWSKLPVLPAFVILGLVSVPAPVASETGPEGARALVDFRMAPLEQARKIHRHLHARPGPGETQTVMRWDGAGEGRHLIVPREQAEPGYVAKQLGSGGFDSVSWSRPVEPVGSCDSTEECEERIDEMCEDAGHVGVNDQTVIITLHADGSKTCSGDCLANGAVAFVTCNPR